MIDEKALRIIVENEPEHFWSTWNRDIPESVKIKELYLIPMLVDIEILPFSATLIACNEFLSKFTCPR